MVDGFNMFDMIDPYAYDSDQVYEIFAGIKSNVAYRRYCDPAMKSEKMGLIRHALQLGLSVGNGTMLLVSLSLGLLWILPSGRYLLGRSPACSTILFLG